MPSRTLTAVWAGLDFALLTAGAILIAFSFIWRAPDLVRDLVISKMDLSAGLILGIMLEISFVVSLFGITQRKSLTSGLKALNWTLVVNSVAIITIGSIVWFYTLTERADFSVVWNAQATTVQTQLQDMFKCCGYFNGTDHAVVGGTFCGDATFAANSTGCVGPLTASADYTLNNIFTTIYGFEAITLALFLSSLCLINKRLEDERFRRIDEKRGHRGFV